jgi:membrane protein implicated in regulation of membrane protease activity
MWHPAPMLLVATTALLVGSRLLNMPLNWQFVTSILWSLSLIWMAFNPLNDQAR